MLKALSIPFFIYITKELVRMEVESNGFYGQSHNPEGLSTGSFT